MHLLLILLVAVLLATTTPVACAADGRASSASMIGLDARLTGYAYPYQVALRRFEAQGELLEMAYMDVSPARDKANGRAVLLLHGKNFCGAYWGSTIEALAAAVSSHPTRSASASPASRAISSSRSMSSRGIPRRCSPIWA
jgi:hypothetical protein